jgi:hypothetical protein
VIKSRRPVTNAVFPAKSFIGFLLLSIDAAYS